MLLFPLLGLAYEDDYIALSQTVHLTVVSILVAAGIAIVGRGVVARDGRSATEFLRLCS